METGVPEATADVLDPAPINCRTCHQIHSTYTAADYAFTASGPVTFKNESHGTFDFGDAAGNLCAQCHQARGLSPMPVPGGDPVTFTSSRYGYHHGPQSTVLAGVGAVEFAGSKTITGGPTSHGNPAANTKLCATCHMGQAYGEQAGGHTWKMTYEYHGSERENTAGCETCHGDDFEGFDALGDTPGTVLALLEELEDELLRVGIKRANSVDYTLHGLSVYAFQNVEYPADVAGAFLNWQMFAEDRSLGLHNPKYAKAVLQNSIEVLAGY
jgi:hypothetical protein